MKGRCGIRWAGSFWSATASRGWRSSSLPPSISSSPIRPIICSSAAISSAPNSSRVDGVEDEWDKFTDFAAYDRFTRAWLEAARRVLKPDGALWVIGTYHNIYRVGAIVQDLGFWILNDIVWRKANPMPNFRGRRFTNAHETLLWCARERQSRYTFNYAAMKALNEDLQMRSDWFIPLCGGVERLKVDGRKAHPTQKPEALLHRVNPGRDEARRSRARPLLRHRHHRRGGQALGPALDRHRARPRLRARSPRRGSPPSIPASSELVALESRRDEPRVPFGTLIERGLLKPGEVLFDARRRWTARVRVDGTVISAETRGSIHKVAAEVQGAPACNGWDFWYVERLGQPVSIDILRQQARAQMA